MPREGIEINSWNIHAKEDRYYITQVIVLTAIVVVNLLYNQFDSIPETQGEDRWIGDKGSDTPDDGHFSLQFYWSIFICIKALTIFLDFIILSSEVLYCFDILENLENITVELDWHICSDWLGLSVVFGSDVVQNDHNWDVGVQN